MRDNGQLQIRRKFERPATSYWKRKKKSLYITCYVSTFKFFSAYV